MQIIPVIDLLNGIVVHARNGTRELYQPIHSKLSNSAQPKAIVEGFLNLYEFKTIYIADLNQLTNQGNNTQTILNLLHQYPTLQFWVDQGLFYNQSNKLPTNWKQIIGTESLTEMMISTVFTIDADWVLSLDFSQTFIGSQTTLNKPHQWPKHVIVMTLNRVGSQTGPDWDRLKEIQIISKHSQIIAAGGIRGANDLEKLTRMGIHHSLLSTCLHRGNISRDEIYQLSKHD